MAGSSDGRSHAGDVRGQRNERRDAVLDATRHPRRDAGRLADCRLQSGRRHDHPDPHRSFPERRLDAGDGRRHRRRPLFPANVLGDRRFTARRAGAALDRTDVRPAGHPGRLGRDELPAELDGEVEPRGLVSNTQVTTTAAGGFSQAFTVTALAAPGPYKLGATSTVTGVTVGAAFTVA